jgi:hypothetical protein
VSNTKVQVNLRLSPTAKKILAELSLKSGISQADVVEMLLKQAKRQGKITMEIDLS